MASDRHPDIHCIAPNDQAMMTPEQRAHLSQQCQISLPQLRDLSTSNADVFLPHFELSNSTHPGTVSRWFHAGVGIVGAVTRDVVSNTSNEIAHLAHAVGRGMTAGVEANIIVAENQLPKQIQAVAPEMSRIIHHPGPALANFGHELVQVGGEIGSGIKTLGGDVVDGTASTAEWVAHHKVESAVIAGTAIGAAALEVFSAGTATPVLWAAGATAIGTGVGVHTGFSVGAKLEGDSQQFSILAHPDQYPQSAIAAAQKKVAADLTAPIESLVMTAVGFGAAKVVKLFSDGAEVGGLATASSADVAPAAGEGALTRAAAHPAVAPDAVTMPHLDESRAPKPVAPAPNTAVGNATPLPAPYEPEVFHPQSFSIPLGNQSRIEWRPFVSAKQSLDEGGRLSLNVGVDTDTGGLSVTFGHSMLDNLTHGTHIPTKSLADGLEMRVNGQSVPLNPSDSEGFVAGANRAVKLPGLEGTAALGHDSASTIELSFYGHRIGLYDYDPESRALTRLEAPKSLSAFDIRQFHERPDYAQEWERSGVTISPNETPANQIDLHTHFGGSMRAETIMDVAQQVHTPYQTELLDKYGIKYHPEAVKIVGGRPTVTLDPDNFPAIGGLEKLENMMRIPEDQRTIFRGMEEVYEQRGPLVKDINAFPLYLEHIAKDYQSQGVHYAELSLSDILKPEWREAASKVLPQIEKETGVKLRFMAALWRLENRPGHNMALVNEIKALGHDPHVVGVDFMGEELNTTSSFARELEELAKIKTTRPGFQIRVHAGENDLNPKNIKEALRYATRIGHGVYGVDAETLALAKEHDVIIEFNTNSNLALSNISGSDQLPIKQYLDSGVRVTLGTDGYATYGTSARSEEAVMRSLGLTPADLAKITESDRRYTDMMAAYDRPTNDPIQR